MSEIQRSFWILVRTQLVQGHNYLIAAVVGLAIAVLQGQSLGEAILPACLVLVCLVLVKASDRYTHRDLEALLQLPRHRSDPTFLMDATGKVVLASGQTAAMFEAHRITSLSDLFDAKDAEDLLSGLAKVERPQSVEYYAAFAQKWYRVQCQRAPNDNRILVWLEDITAQKMLELSLAIIRRFSNEIFHSIGQLAKHSDIYDRFCRLVLQEGYQGVLVAREDDDGHLKGHVCKADRGGLCLSDPVTISRASKAPIWSAKRTQRVVTASKLETQSQIEFEKQHRFDERVKAFLGTPITSYVNYYESDLSIIAFNKHGGITSYDAAVMETLVSTIHSIVHLIDLAVAHDEKFLQIITGLCAAAEYSDELTGKHILRVNAYSRLVATHLDQPPEFIEHIGRVAALHDIGKVAIPNIIKLKRALSAEEEAEMRMHTIYGAQIVDRMISMSSHHEPKLDLARNLVLHHHQQWDGGGYPGLLDRNGEMVPLERKNASFYRSLRPLAGNQIPIEALIVSLADKYDALRSARSYKTAYTHAETKRRLVLDDRTGFGGKAVFGPQLFELFMDIHSEFDAIYEQMRDDGAAPG